MRTTSGPCSHPRHKQAPRGMMTPVCILAPDLYTAVPALMRQSQAASRDLDKTE